MSVVSICAGDTIIFKNIREQEYEGFVLASEPSGYVWAIVPALEMVYELNIINVVEIRGMKRFNVYDRSRSMADVAKGQTPGRSDLFAFAENPQSLINLVKTYKLIS